MKNLRILAQSLATNDLDITLEPTRVQVRTTKKHESIDDTSKELATSESNDHETEAQVLHFGHFYQPKVTQLVRAGDHNIYLETSAFDPYRSFVPI